MTAATTFSTELAQLTGNAGGAVQSLPGVNLVGGRQRTFVSHLALAAQASGAVIGIARIPLNAVIIGIEFITDTSLSTSTISVGDTNNATAYSPAFTLTTTNTPFRAGSAAGHGNPILTGYDCVSGAQASAYEDITLTVGVAALPGSGNLLIKTEYLID